MDFNLLNPEVQKFISANFSIDPTNLALRKNPFTTIDWKEIISQISAKQKAKDKLPTWFNTENILYPTKISLEQTSSEKTSAYKAELVYGENLIDLTGGFGVDDYYFSKKFENVIHCEINSELSDLVQHNFKQLKVKNIKCLHGDSKQILKDLNQKTDWIYIDPSRRNDTKGKVFLLKDCLPNVPQLMDFYFQYSHNILLKTAPILDLTAGLLELKNVKEIHIIAVENEVKELLWVIQKDFKNSVEIKTINLLKNNVQTFNFKNKNSNHLINYGLPKKYLYEPNSAIMKSGGFNEISEQFSIEKLHSNSHLYTSDILIDFPGRIFEIENIFGYQKDSMKIFLENKKANVTTRNFPDTVEVIRKKWKIKDGGNLYSFFTTDLNDAKIVVLCVKIN